MGGVRGRPGNAILGGRKYVFFGPLTSSVQSRYGSPINRLFHPDTKVIIGGFETYDRSTLVYSVSQDSYARGPDIQADVTDSVAVPFKDTFILIGGYDFYHFADSDGN